MSDEIQVINQETLPLSEMTLTGSEADKGNEVPQNNSQKSKEEFSLDGYQVVRGEFFAHLFEPSVTFNDEKVAVNVACLRKLPEVEYVQFLVNPREKKLAVKPCTEDTKDSFRWASGDEPGKRKPKHITCRIFYAKVLNLMGWSLDYRYKILGKLIRTATDQIFVFDLSCAETYKKKGGEDKGETRKALYPESWQNQFGVPATQHQDTVQINIFDDYTVFRIERDVEEGAEHERNADSNITGLQEEQDQNPQENSENA